MNANGYQKKCLEYLSDIGKASKTNMMLEGAIGLCGESGEAAEIIKKIIFQGHELTDDAKYNIALEIGDVLWYAAVLAHALDYDFESIMAMNMAKLGARYGKAFSIKASVERKDTNA